jgi:hypothetical protein
VFTLTVVAGALLIALAFVGVVALLLDPDSFSDGNWGGPLVAVLSAIVAGSLVEAFAPSVPGLLGARAGAWTVVTAGTLADAPSSSGVGWFGRQEGVGIASGGWPDPPELPPGSRLYGLVACRGGTSGLTLEQGYAWNADGVDGSRVFPDDTFFETGPMPCDGTPHGAALVGDAPSVPVEAENPSTQDLASLVEALGTLR